jgi:hypothetical protein
VRRFVPQLAALILISGTLAPFAAASIPSSNAARDIDRSLTLRSAADARQFTLPGDQHPFATEFYLQGLEGWTDLGVTPARRQHSFMHWRPVSAAASNLSKMVASWRHALARVIPTP